MNSHGRLIIGWLTGCILAGCAGGDTTLIRAELRDKEARIREYREQLAATESQRDSLRRENDALREQLQQANLTAFSPEHAAAVFSIEDISFQQVTGGIDTDALPGDDALLVLLQPHDHEGDLRKAPGSVQIELFDMTHDDGQRRIGRWEFDADQTRAHWYSGFLMDGYRFELPWQQGYPQHDQLSLLAKFRTPDGRVFAETTQIRVRLLPGVASGQAGIGAPRPSQVGPRGPTR